MTPKFHTLTLAAFVTMAGAMGAAASTIDFTDEGAYTITDDLATGTTDGIGWTLDSNPPDSRLRYTQEFDGDAAPVTPLALENDGIGVSFLLPDDEVSFPRESLTMTFDSEASVTGFYFLDLFGAETVEIYDENNVLLTTVTASSADLDNSVGGYTYFAFDASVTSLTFVPGPLNDSLGRPDFALAGVDLAAIPVPAAGLLLLTALGGLGLARRRKSA
jgi:hypothetical protein